MLDPGDTHSYEFVSPLLNSFKQDEIYNKFLHPLLDTSAFASTVIKSGQVTQCREKLASGIASLQEELRGEVIGRHDELLHQVASLQSLDSMLSIVNAGVYSLQASVGRLKGDVSEPFEKMKTQIEQLGRILAATHLLRRIHRFLQLVNTLRSQLYGVDPDLAKAAQAVFELECEIKEKEINGIAVVEEQAGFVEKAGSKVRADAEKSLTKGLEELNQADVGSSLQVFYNVRCLADKVGMVIAKITDHVSHTVHATLDASTLADDVRGGSGGVGMPGGARANVPPAGKNAAWRSTLWARVESMLEAVHTSSLQVWHLQRVLAKKRDPATRACFLDELVQRGEPTITQAFWKSLTDIFREEFEYACKSSTFIQDTFVAEYPKLLRLFNDFLSKLTQQIKNFQGSIAGSEQQSFLEGALQNLENLYLNASFQRLSSRTSALFSANSKGVPPNRSDVETLCKVIQDELSPVSSHTVLCASVARNASKALRVFAANIEQLVVTSGEAVVLGKGTTPAQQTNAALCNSTAQLMTVVASLTQMVTESAQTVLLDANRQLENVAEQCIAPVFLAVRKKLENTVLAMHKEDWTKGPGADVTGSTTTAATSASPECSRYMRVVVRQLSNFRENVLALYTTTPMLQSYCRGLASHLLTFFVRHLALIRPLSEEGKLKMTADMAQLEAALSPFCAPLQRLGAPYRALRSLKHLIFLDNDAIASSPERENVPPSVVIHHLFSRAPEELQLPHVRLAQTEAQYSDWLEIHPESDSWQQCQASLEAYARKVTARGDPQFCPVYTVILSLGPALLSAQRLDR